MTKTDDLAGWCASYVAAFSDYDAAGISAHWQFPALILSGGHNLVFKSRDVFDANTGALLGFYKRQSVARAERRLTDALMMSNDVAAIRVADRMLNAGGAEIVSWQAAYTLRRTNEGWRAILAAADGELAAWTERGTPLGSG